MVKIGYISLNGYLGGAEKFVLEALKAHQAHSEIQATLICFNPGPLVDRCQNLGLKVRLIDKKFRFRNPWALASACFELRKVILSNGIDIVHATMGSAQFLSSLALMGTKVKKIWFQHGPVGGVVDILASFFRVDLIYFNSQFTQKAHQALPLCPQNQKHKLLRLGIDNDSSCPQNVFEIRKKYLPPPKKILLILAGRITAWKGQDIAIKAMQLLKSHAPALFFQTHLLVIGSAKTKRDLPFKKYLNTLSTQLNIGPSISFIPEVNDLSNYLKASDILLHCSLTPEPFGLIIAEAMKYETLVIGPGTGGSADLLINDKTGLTFDINSPYPEKKLMFTLVDALSEQIEGSDSFKGLTDNAKRLIHEDYDLSQMANQLQSDALNLMKIGHYLEKSGNLSNR